MTSGSKLEKISLLRSVGGFHGVQVCSGVFLVMRWMMLEKVLVVAALRGWLCFVAKSSWQAVWMGWLAPYPYLGFAVIRIRGQDALPGLALSCRVRMVGGVFLGHYPRPWMLVEVLCRIFIQGPMYKHYMYMYEHHMVVMKGYVHNHVDPEGSMI
jgi:hypothetical protein